MDCLFLIWCHGWYWYAFSSIWWSQATIFRAWLEGWLASYIWYWMVLEFLFFIFGWSGIGQFLAAVYFYQHLTFMRLHQHASSALISLLLITCPILIWPDLIRSDDISLLWSDLGFFSWFFAFFSAEKYFGEHYDLMI